MQNPGFESGLEGWETQRGTPQVDPDDGSAGAAVKFVPGPNQTVRVEQRLTGLRPETKYTFAAQVRTQGADVWAGYGIESGAQVSKTNSVQAADWADKRFTFYTKSGADSVTVFLESFQTDTPGYVLVDNVRVIEGDLPLPSAPDAGWPSPPATVSLPAAGQQIVRNGDFTDGAAQWSLDDGSVQSDTLTLQSSADKTARAVQDTGVLLASNKTYELNVRARASSGQPTVGIVVGSNYHHATVTAANFTDYRVRFTTTQAQESGKILLERWKGSPGTLEVQSVSLFAEGGEWLDTPDPVPTRTTNKLVEEFDGPLDPNKWLIVDRAWGGDNGGLVPENATLGNGILRLAGHGDQYSGNVVGHGGRKTRVGAGIATRDYYASGKYVVRARLPKELGAVSAFWSFHYIEKIPSEPGYWDEPNRIRNTEIDWEFPTDLSNGTMHDPISYQNGRANTWGGKFGGEGAHHPGRVDFGNSVADGKFHDFGIEWHSGSA
ncbi:MAG: glycoside hydrolase family 16 protein, partial [Actinomycetia bacterium]|nr:glycoside hydrolase family 16 protein [Actinomycetes bacterium]